MIFKNIKNTILFPTIISVQFLFFFIFWHTVRIVLFYTNSIFLCVPVYNMNPGKNIGKRNKNTSFEFFFFYIQTGSKYIQRIYLNWKCTRNIIKICNLFCVFLVVRTKQNFFENYDNLYNLIKFQWIILWVYLDNNCSDAVRILFLCIFTVKTGSNCKNYYNFL